MAVQVPISQLDYNHYLPLFFDGLRETEHPWEFFARQGVHDMLEHGTRDNIVRVIPQIIIPVKGKLTATAHVMYMYTVTYTQAGIIPCQHIIHTPVLYYGNT